MAANEEVLFTHLVYQPEVDGFVEPGLSPEFARPLEFYTQGRFSLRGGNISDAETGRIVARVATSAGATMEVGTDGTVLLNNVVSKRRLAEAMGSNAIPRAYIEGDLSAFGAAFPADVNRTITLAPHGQVLYVDDSKRPGKGAYAGVRSAVFGPQGPPQSNSLGRIATSEDLLIRGVAGWLGRNAPAAIERLKLGGFTLPDGTQTISGSDIVRAIAANISVTPIVTYVLQAGQ